MATSTTGTKAKSTTSAKKATENKVETVVKATAENTTKSFEKAMNVTQDKVQAAMKSLSGLSDHARDNIDAFVSAGTVAAKGVEALNTEVMAMSKRSMDDAAAAAKALTGAKTAKEFFELQSDLMRSSWDAMVSETSKIGEILTQYSKEASAPINDRVTATVEQISKPLSA